MVGNLGATTFAVVYLGWLPSFAVLTRSDTNVTDPVVGAWTILIVLLVVFASDIGALYVGRAIGRHKLAPVISPGKSVEGFVGGVVASVLVTCGLKMLASMPSLEAEPITSAEKLIAFSDELTQTVARLSMLEAVLFAAAVSVASQVGDLFESVIKRSAKVKDSGRLVPGMGGLLDVVDGAVFAVPLAYFLLTKVWQVL
jgi:phosphatidate cytidylyltransferase